MNFGQMAFAIGMIASGVLNIANQDFYASWVPAWIPTHGVVASVCGALMIAGGIGLLMRKTATIAARVLLGFTGLWLVLMNTPRLFAGPQNELNWLAWGEIAVIVAGALTLAASNEGQLRVARYLMGAAVLPIGLSHFVFLSMGSTMVPGGLPYHKAWVIFTGAAHMAAGLAILTGVLARLATILESGMVTAFAPLVWLIPAIEHPGDMRRWAPFVVTLAVAGGAWAVASKMPVTKSAPAA